VRSFAAQCADGAVLLIVQEDELVVLVNHFDNHPLIGIASPSGEALVPLCPIGGLPSIANVLVRADESEASFEFDGALPFGPLEASEAGPSRPFVGTYEGKIHSFVNGGHAHLTIHVGADHRLEGEIVTHSGTLVMKGKISDHGMASLNAAGIGTASGQTGRLQGNFLPGVSGIIAAGVYTGGGGDYGEWAAAAKTPLPSEGEGQG